MYQDEPPKTKTETKENKQSQWPKGSCSLTRSTPKQIEMLGRPFLSGSRHPGHSQFSHGSSAMGDICV
jgi:hypothetical protein